MSSRHPTSQGYTAGSTGVFGRAVRVIACLYMYGCGVTEPSAEVALVVTEAVLVDRSSRQVLEVDFLVQNGLPDTIVVSTCGDLVMAGIERRVGAAWEPYGGGACRLGWVLCLAPGDTAVGWTGVGLASAGLYRLVLEYSKSAGESQGPTRSAEFAVTEP